jgi:hypothetical protein
MRIDQGVMVPLGYGKFFRSDSVVGLEPVEENRGPGRRTKVYIENLSAPVIASRSENAILRDLVGIPREEMRTQEQHQLLADILSSIEQINPLVRSIIREQGKWDLDRVEERIRDALGEAEEE